MFKICIQLETYNDRFNGFQYCQFNYVNCSGESLHSIRMLIGILITDSIVILSRCDAFIMRGEYLSHYWN